MKDVYKKIAFIGNGFDIAHGYKTMYKDFANSILVEKDKSEKINRFIEILKKYKLVDDVHHWYDFENQIKRMVPNHENISMIGQDNSHNADEFNQLVLSLSDYLKEYLKKEVDGKKNIKESINKELDENTIAIDFNYTDTISMYDCDVYYVHGSLKENNIIIGYDGYDDGSMHHFFYEHRMWLKDYRRDRIEFVRAMEKKNIGIDISLALEEFDNILKIQNTGGRGCEESDFDGLRYGAYIKDFMDNKNDFSTSELYQLNKIDFEAVETIVNIGHSIQSDEFYLNSILSKCENIKEIRIFKYAKEEPEEINKKKAFYSKYVPVKCIKIIDY